MSVSSFTPPLVCNTTGQDSVNMGNVLTDQHIAIVGLDCARKTTVLYRLLFNGFVNTVPTKAFNTERVKVHTATFHFWDVGGHEKLRPLWRLYTRRADAIMFVVDSADSEHIEEAKMELHEITQLAQNQGVPVLVVANKQNLRNSLSLAQMESLLALGELRASTPWHLQSACAVTGEGLQEGLEKLHAMILQCRRPPVGTLKSRIQSHVRSWTTHGAV